MTGEELPMTDLAINSQLHEANPPIIGIGEPAHAEEGKSRKLKKPRRVLHFSDGTLEEYSTDEEEEKPEPDPMTLLDPKKLTWGPWMYYWMLYSGSSALSACDYVGESLANFLGITSPKYQYEIDEFKRSLEEEKAKKEEEDAEMAGWRTPGSTTTNVEDQVVSTPAVHQPPSPTQSLKQNPQGITQESSKNIDGTPPVPSVTLTSETNKTVHLSDSSSSAAAAAAHDSTGWERF